MDLSLGDTHMIVDACLQEGLLRNQCAYVLATAYHESAHLMKPITELGGQKYLKSKPYYPFIGRGYVQLTWEVNYKKAGDKLGVDFVKNPLLLLQAEYAAPILVIGMKEGWFTGKKLSTYITLGKSDFKGARRIINGTDKDTLIAGYAQQYDDLLLNVGYGVTKPQQRPPAPAAPIPAPQTPAPVPAAPVPPVAGPRVSTPSSTPPVINKPAAAAGIVFAVAATLMAFWHHVTAFFGSIF